MTTPLQITYQWQDADGNPITSILDMPEANPGTPSASVALRLSRIQNSPAAETALMLGATLWSRGVSGGTSEEGSEMISESWLEYSNDDETWIPIGAGPSEDISGLDFSESYAVIYLRLNIPEGAVTNGDFRAHLEVFAR